MKNSAFGKIVLLLLATFWLHACGGTSGGSNSNLSNDSGDVTSPKSGLIGGTETGTTEGGLQVKANSLSTKLNAAAGALIPNIKASGSVSSSVSKSVAKLTYGSESDWDKYLEDSRRYHLTDIFGDPDEAPGVVTKLRVLTKSAAKTVEEVFSYDPSLTCFGAKKLNEGKTISIPFFSKLDNGSTKNNAFDCFLDNYGGHTDIIYGIDDDGVGRIAVMQDETMDNTDTNDASLRGDYVQYQSIIYITFGEQEESKVTVVYIDIQYAQFTQYSGADNEYDTGDEIDFKSRSRITGRVGLDDDWQPVFATGDFRVTKYDRGINGDGGHWSGGTKYSGRGSFDGDAYFIFSIDSNMSPLVNLDHNFCIQQEDETGATLPDDVDSDYCEDLEEAFAWGNIKLPFPLLPDLEKIFVDNDYYNINDTDLIADDRDNFVIPTYKTK
ncbi:MAG: hypothetical protein Q7S68_00720 [Deltaproteobacteria bacterium]|nr:hypothetical protein [Deltaproteobacteria bacterium]